MATRYDARPIVAMAASMQTVATAIEIGSTVVGLGVGAIALLALWRLNSLAGIVTLVVLGAAGYMFGSNSALRRRVDAQMMLALVQIESNTRPVLAADSPSGTQTGSTVSAPETALDVPLWVVQPYQAWLENPSRSRWLTFLDALEKALPQLPQTTPAAAALAAQFPEADGQPEFDSLVDFLAKRDSQAKSG